MLRLTDGKGVDHTFEVSGAHTLMKSVHSTRVGGLISLIGILTEMENLPAEFVPDLMYSGRIGRFLDIFKGFCCSYSVVKGCVAFSRDALADFARFVEEHGIKPVIARTFEFAQAVDAYDVAASEYGGEDRDQDQG